MSNLVIDTQVSGSHECARCGAPSYLTAYWGEPLCQDCTHALAELFDAKGEWPQGQ